MSALGANRTCRDGGNDVNDPGCVKTHTSAKCRKHNSPARRPTSRVQYDLTLRDAIAQRYFYVWRERRSFRTAKTHPGHWLCTAPIVSVPIKVPVSAASELGNRYAATRVHHAAQRCGGGVAARGAR